MPRRYKTLTSLQRQAVPILYRSMGAFEVSMVLECSESTIWRVLRNSEEATRTSGKVHEPSAPEGWLGGDDAFVQPSPVQIVEVSLMRAMDALRRGDSVEAIRLTEAGGKVGEFAELVKLVRARAGGGSPESRGDG